MLSMQSRKIKEEVCNCDRGAMTEPCFIVGGGPSLQNFDYRILRNRHVIAVNQAIFQLPTAQHFITMDYTWLEKSHVLSGGRLTDTKGQVFHHHPAQKHFVLAFSEPRLGQIGPSTYMDHQYEMTYDLSMFNQVIRAIKYGGVGFSFDSFCVGSDSGYSAIQLAVILGYKVIYLLGFDFCISGQATHGHTDYHLSDLVRFDNRLKEYITPYPQMFEILRSKGIQVLSGSHISRLNRYILYVDVRHLLTEML